MNTVNNLQIFNSSTFGELRTTVNSNGILFCLNDVMRPLGLSNVTDLKKRLKSDGLDTIEVTTQRTNQHGVGYDYNVDMIFINEPNLYRCIFQSRKKEAEQFQDWVFEEVLPTIRETGGYIVEKEEDTPEMIMARALEVASKTIEEHKRKTQMLQAQNELQSEQLKLSAPKVQYVDSVLQSNSTYTFTQIAKELDLSSANALTKRLKESGVIYRQSGQWMIASKYSGKGFTKTRTHQFVKSDGTSGTNTITVWTEKGREFIHKLINQKLHSYA